MDTTSFCLRWHSQRQALCQTTRPYRDGQIIAQAATPCQTRAGAGCTSRWGRNARTAEPQRRRGRGDRLTLSPNLSLLCALCASAVIFCPQDENAPGANWFIRGARSLPARPSRPAPAAQDRYRRACCPGAGTPPRRCSRRRPSARRCSSGPSGWRPAARPFAAP